MKFALLLAGLGIGAVGRPADAQTVPTDAQSQCSLSPSVFSGWFTSGTVSVNGTVNPADSINFANAPNCSFYQWSEQMFLWLTSPAPFTYGGGGGHVFESPVFYNVSAPDPATGLRTLQQMGVGVPLRFNLRASQLGPHGLPVVIDKPGSLLSIRQVQLGPTGKAVVPDVTGKLVEFSSIKLGDDGRLAVLDKSQTPIEVKRAANGAPILLDRAGKQVAISAIKFGTNGLIFIDAFGNVLGFEEGQAGDASVLEAQNGSLVYYAIFVNDVYASFLTGFKNRSITPNPVQFPINIAALSQITAFNGNKAFPDANVLAVEVKTAWVETTGLDATKYVTINATIPTYDKSNPAKWTVNGSKSAQLALVGLHVAGSALGHPELIWATFEHIGNSPDAAYSYNSTTGVKPVAQTTSGSWLFCASNSSGPFNVPHMTASGSDIVAAAGMTVSPSDTLRVNAWGSSPTQTPNPFASPAASNSDIILMNNSVLNMLISPDVRQNYILKGATWTALGAPPNGEFGVGGNEVGTSQMANTTMETYQQGSDCLDCHNGNMLGTTIGTGSNTQGIGLSHIFGTIKPLP